MRRTVKIVGWLACAILFVWIATQLQSEALQTFDLGVTRALAATRTPFVTLCMRGFTALCHPVTLLVICLALMFLLRHKHYSIPIAINLIVSVVLNCSLKLFFLRDRPPLEYRAILEVGYSFPSGHTMAATAFYGFLIYMVRRSALKPRLKNALTAALLLIVLGVGFSRVYLGVHYLTDVIAGVAVAAGYLIVFTSGVTWYLNAGQTRKPDGTPQNGKLLESFGHAFEGIASGMKSERNMMLHFAAMALVTVFGFLFNISGTEWLICVILFGLVIGAELINTAIETTVNICMPQVDPRAKLAKDTAAGAVLAVSISAAVAGMIIFLPKLLRSILVAM